ncbi:MAG: hypothetical protein QG608_160 [Actinomycetota bacterium]|nr:hypothetical protein [Actinomycetota bacterium]
MGIFSGSDGDVGDELPSPGQTEVTPLSRDRITHWLESNDYAHFVDHEGDVGGLWRGRLFHFLLLGRQTEILQIRGQWNREAAIERLGEVLEICNTWNRERIWPKTYARVRDDGMVCVIAEESTDLEPGVTDGQLSQLLHCGLTTGSMFFDSLDERFPDPVAAAP